jgi:hypothetical protein
MHVWPGACEQTWQAWEGRYPNQLDQRSRIRINIVALSAPIANLVMPAARLLGIWNDVLRPC